MNDKTRKKLIREILAKHGYVHCSLLGYEKIISAVSYLADHPGVPLYECIEDYKNSYRQIVYLLKSSGCKQHPKEVIFLLAEELRNMEETA